MTLRVKFEIVPYGVESDTYEIGYVDISNIEEVENLGFGHSICNYSYKAFRNNEDEPFSEGLVGGHDRRDGAIKLVERVLSGVGSF